MSIAMLLMAFQSQAIPYKNSIVKLYQHKDYRGYSVSLDKEGIYNLRELRALGMKNDDISSLKVNPGFKVTVFQHDKQQGWGQIFKSDAPWIGTAYNDQVSSLLIERIRSRDSAREAKAPVKLFQHANFKGYVVKLHPGSYTLRDLVKLGMSNDDISSLKVSPGYKVTVYQHDHFRGRGKTFNSNNHWIGNTHNDEISSVVVEQVGIIQPPFREEVAPVRLYQHKNFQGYSVHLTPGSYRLGDLERLGMKNDDISSLKVSPGYRVTVYQHDHFRGWRKTYSQNQSWVGSNYNDQFSSVKIEKIDRRMRISRPPYREQVHAY